MELNDALRQIADIQLQMARTRVFRGYRSNTTLFSAGVAAITAVVQAIALPNPAGHLMAYLIMWFSAAMLCIVVVGLGIAVRYWRTDSSLERELTLLAVEQFIPSLVAGGLLTYILVEVAWSSLWIAPGLWMILFGLGVLASRQLLPREIKWVGAFYLLCGLLAVAWVGSHTAAAYSPWIMGIPFGLGQLAAAIILYLKLERNDATA
jgi:hypothetical protein